MTRRLVTSFPRESWRQLGVACWRVVGVVCSARSTSGQEPSVRAARVLRSRGGGSGGRRYSRTGGVTDCAGRAKRRRKLAGADFSSRRTEECGANSESFCRSARRWVLWRCEDLSPEPSRSSRAGRSCGKSGGYAPRPDSINDRKQKPARDRASVPRERLGGHKTPASSSTHQRNPSARRRSHNPQLFVRKGQEPFGN